MLKRFLLFGLGAIISIFFLSLGPENRLKETFYHYVNYFDLDERVLYHLRSDTTVFSAKSECQLLHYVLSKEDVLTILDGGEVNFSKSDKKSSPCKLYLIENEINNEIYEVLFEFCDTEQNVSVLNINILDQDSVCND
jgi:hypothetical protein